MSICLEKKGIKTQVMVDKKKLGISVGFLYPYGQPPTSSSPLPTTKWEWVKAHSRPLTLAGGLIGGPLIVGVANRSSSMENTLLIQSLGALITLASLYYMTQTHDYQLPNQ